MAQPNATFLRHLVSLTAWAVLGLLAAGAAFGADPSPSAPAGPSAPAAQSQPAIAAAGVGAEYEFVKLWPQQPREWHFDQPNGVACDKAGNVYVVPCFGYVTKFSPAGKCLAQWGSEGDGDGQFRGASGIAVDAAGNLYVTERQNHRVQVLGADGKFLRKWGSMGDGEGQFQWPLGIALDKGGNVYVTDRTSDRVQKFTGEGKFLAAWGAKGAGPGQFDAPTRIAVAESGEVYVLDSGNKRVQKLSADGKPLGVLDVSGAGPGRGQAPAAFTIDGAGNVYLIDNPKGANSAAVLVFDKDGKFLRQWGSDANTYSRRINAPADVTIDPNGRVIVAEAWSYRLHVMDAAGNTVANWGQTGSGPGEFIFAYGIATGRDGCVYVLDTNNNRVEKFNSDGALLGILDEGNMLAHAAGVALDKGGNLYVMDGRSHSRIRKYGPDFKFLKQWGGEGKGDGQFDTPHGNDLAVAPDGSVYACDQLNHRVQKFTADGNFLLKWGTKGAGDGEFDMPTGIAVDANGCVYVSEAGNHRVQKFTADGKFLLKFGGRGSGPGQMISADYAMGLMVDLKGRVWVADRGNHRLDIFSSQGEYLGFLGSHGAAPGQMNSPVGMAMDPSGNLYVLDCLNSRVQKFKPRKSE